MKKLTDGLSQLLESLGDRLLEADIQKTPERVSKMYTSFLTSSQASRQEALGTPHFIENSQDQDLILIDNIPFCSLCEHHLVPFFGKVHISYIPRQHILGLSRFSTYIDQVCRQLQIQERLGKNIIQGLFEKLEPLALKIKIVGMHSCLAMLGQTKGAHQLTTQHFRGDPLLEPKLTQSLNVTP